MTQRPRPYTDAFDDPADRAVATRRRELVDQTRARVAVPPHAAVDGFWFGSGNAVRDDDGAIWLVGRYRDAGDSRTGLEAGVRGAELAVFRSDDDGRSFEKRAAWTKRDLSRLGDVTSIEGSALTRRADGTWEAFVSLEKARPYPRDVAELQKPGTGVWSIDRLVGPRPDALDVASQAPVLASDDPVTLHVKDPVVARDGERTLLWACAHPASWASSNTVFAVRPDDAAPFAVASWQHVPRGAMWDVAVTRITHRLLLPQVGRFADRAHEVLFYDGAECMRPLEANPRSAARPRGYSCEELGGALWGPVGDPAPLRRLSRLAPLFVSPHGTGCSRYVSTLATDDALIAFWQQGQADGSQPLVTHRLPLARVHEILASA